MELDETADSGTRATTQPELAPGGSLGKYRLVRVLGEGGMGVVWAAHDPDLERAVAIKVLRYAQAAVQLRQRLLREARAMAKLKHPNVLTVYEVGTVGDRDYIAMELVDGTTLDRWLAAKPPQEELWSAILAAGRGLAAAHAAGVVHRDFKPHNVLRSRDGRVLVTDFGLARGLLGEEESAAVDAHAPLPDPSTTPALDATLQAPQRRSGAPVRASDSLLDAPLTQTGALIGTPAYMAPEQYAGAPPDPRTDQFAFCVTAWQAFTGERPFKGHTLDEMRRAVGGGVAHLQPKLPRAVRAALARGLDPHAEARWPTLEALLDELERIGRAPVRRRRIVLSTIGSVLMLGAAVLYLVLREDKPVATACDAPEEAFAEAWSPALRSELQRASNLPIDRFTRIAAAFDQLRERWVAGYQKACRSRSAKVFPARIRCLEGVRDQVSAMSLMLRSAPSQVYDAFDPHGMLPNLASCERAEPDAPPVFPSDQPRRTNVTAIMARVIGLRLVPHDQLAAAVTALERDASAVGWLPAVQAVRFTAGTAFLRYGDATTARAHYRRALDGFREPGVHDRRLEALVYLGLADAAMQELARPGTGAPPGRDDPRAEPVLHPELRDAFAAAGTAARDDAMLRGGIAGLQAEAYLHLAQWSRYRSAYAEAIARAQEARKYMDSIGDVRRAASESAIEARIYLQRGDDRALDDALFAARRAADALEAAGLPPLAGLDEIRIAVAFARRDYHEVHRLLDKHVQPHTNAQATVTGRVEPAGRTRVIAWRGELVGDPKRAYTDPSGVELDVVETDETGAFTIHAEPGWAIIAERADLRSMPQVVGTAPLSLALRPTRTVSGTVLGKNLFGVHAFGMLRLGTSTWSVHVPVEKDGTFDLRGLPADATFVFGTTGEAGDGTRRVLAGPSSTALTWPHGQALDVIVRSKEQDDGARVWVFRGLVPKMPTRADLDAITETRFDVATATLHPVGATNTDAGRDLYQHGDRHAVITGNAEGTLGVCVAMRAGGDAKVQCQSIEVRPSVVIEYPDGRFAAGVTPIVLEP